MLIATTRYIRDFPDYFVREFLCKYGKFTKLKNITKFPEKFELSYQENCGYSQKYVFVDFLLKLYRKQNYFSEIWAKKKNSSKIYFF